MLDALKFSLNMLTHLVIDVAREQWKSKHPFLHKFVCFQMTKKPPGLKYFKSLVRNNLFLKDYVTISELFLKCFIPLTALHCSLPSKFLCWQLFWVITRSAFKLNCALSMNVNTCSWPICHLILDYGQPGAS